MAVSPHWFAPASGAAEFYTAERCYITELLNNQASPQLSLAIARVLPGVTTQLHSLVGITETYVLRSGKGLVEIDGQQQAVEVGDQVTVAAGLPQCIQNTGNTDLEFYCVCTPRFTPDSYVDLEKPERKKPDMHNLP